MDELLKDMLDKGLVSIEKPRVALIITHNKHNGDFNKCLLELAQNTEKKRYLRKLFCLPIFKVSFLYWHIYFRDNRN